MKRILHVPVALISLLLTLFWIEGAASQTLAPAMPSDRGAVYVADASGALSPIPYEVATTALSATAVAKSDKTGYIEIPGERSKTAVTAFEPRLYVFIPDRPGEHPPFLVMLTSKKGARRVTALTERGRAGYAIAGEEIVKPHYRVLGQEGGLAFMEITPRSPLVPGEYAIMGRDLSKVATFTVRAGS
jgi:hypothetical protein